MFDIQLRELKDYILTRMLMPILTILSKLGVTANQISLASLIFGIASAISCFKLSTYSALIFWIINRILDGIDGIYSKYTLIKACMPENLDSQVCLVVTLILYLIS